MLFRIGIVVCPAAAGGVLPTREDKLGLRDVQVLSSAIGGSAAMTDVSRNDVRRQGPVLLMCSDGLTKHVTDEEIEQQVGTLQSSEQLCR